MRCFLLGDAFMKIMNRFTLFFSLFDFCLVPFGYDNFPIDEDIFELRFQSSG